MVDRETRKLQQVGGSTLTVSIPKDWADAMGLEAGDEVMFDEDGAALRLSPLKEDSKEPVTCVIDAGRTDEDLLGRCIVGGYILGYEVLEIRDDSGLDRGQVNAVHRTMRQLNGTSIVEQDDTSIRLRNFMDVSEASIYVIMRRLSTTVLHMLDSALYGLLQGRTDLLEEVREMEDEVDVLYWLILRQLLTAVEDESTREDIGSRPRSTSSATGPPSRHSRGRPTASRTSPDSSRNWKRLAMSWTGTGRRGSQTCQSSSTRRSRQPSRA